LTPGDFVLRTITGREQRVEATAVAPFEVTEERAKEWLQGEFGNILDNARGAVNRFLERLQGGSEPDRIADLRELLDRVEAIVELIVAASPDGERAAEDIEASADRLDGIEARLRQLAKRLRAVRATD
jgi:DNA repair ATPase RecN